MAEASQVSEPSRGRLNEAFPVVESLFRQLPARMVVDGVTSSPLGSAYDVCDEPVCFCSIVCWTHYLQCVHGRTGDQAGIDRGVLPKWTDLHRRARTRAVSPVAGHA
jgi:hypothetical protein